MSVLSDRRDSFAETGPSATRSNWVGWALFLGISWTWCIGMFLPVLLVRDYGLWGWIVFAIPNVIGAGAMGWTLDAERSRQISVMHREMLDCFAMVTSGFQIFFIGWLGNVILGRSGWLLVVLLLTLSAIVQTWRSAKPQKLAIVAASISGTCVVVAVLCTRTSLVVPSTNRGGLPAEVMLLVASCLGFGLCPYLDPTFHRARQALDAKASKLAFGVGFGVIFFGMIVFTLFYAVAVERGVWSPASMSRALAILLLAHWGIEALVTIVFQTQGDGSAEAQKRTGLRSAGAAVLATVGLVVAFVVYPKLADGGELIYWLFMSMYGLLFPAYVWLCIIPGRGRTRATPRMLLVTLIVCVMAMPFFWLAFIDRHMPVVIGGVAIVLIARLAVGPRTVAVDHGGIDQQNSAPTS